MEKQESAYSKKLRDPRWQKKRLEILQRDEFTCQKCYDSTTTLHVHHRRYVAGRDPWEYAEGDLVTLCEPCHTEETQLWQEMLWHFEEAVIIRGLFSCHVEEIAEALAAYPKQPELLICFMELLVKDENAQLLMEQRLHDFVAEGKTLVDETDFSLRAE